jgi:hypothetical protein
MNTSMDKARSYGRGVLRGIADYVEIARLIFGYRTTIRVNGST